VLCTGRATQLTPGWFGYHPPRIISVANLFPALTSSQFEMASKNRVTARIHCTEALTQALP
jgi:hypothetical protein